MSGGYIQAQTISESNKILIDSLKSENSTVFVIDEFCLGCGKMIGEREPANQSNGCSYIDEYWIIWFKKEIDSIRSKMTNDCYDLLSVNSEKSFTVSLLDQLFERIFHDSTENEVWIEPNLLDTDNQYPIMGSSFYRITKFVGLQEYSINFNENLFINNSEHENSQTVEYLLNEILIDFDKEKVRLAKYGEKNKINWQ